MRGIGRDEATCDSIAPRCSVYRQFVGGLDHQCSIVVGRILTGSTRGLCADKLVGIELFITVPCTIEWVSLPFGSQMESVPSLKGLISLNRSGRIAVAGGGRC